ncbi:dopamine D2-like receptor isoform X1 [Hydra vulgaris]|uniref:dopamine D2-like receptor isoform X1 n=1 Tax=Hydra vulgaris TaxID=6087 RepID=UPI001F5F97A5|nr:dopamine D2-like receptor [Hydra vulgaris]XP_047138733.1 dopamine D2-like receptor [Hydra vulgaris]XP_047138734.1 dopamine D2-like receptor [Hydra vulgaris]XP_047138736.1 dopamine D2-like receptor [Hydra vulgaris]XP_047138737.1 dopamine D2-like receptor [Hydra vulgaris]
MTCINATFLNTTCNSTNNNMTSSISCQISKVSIQIYLYTLLMVIVLLTSFVGNSLVVVAALMSRQLRSKISTSFVVSLAFSDLTLSVTQIPFKILTQNFCFGNELCYFYIVFDVIGNVASILSLLLIAVDRFVAITMPFRYPKIINKLRGRVLIVTVWTFAIAWSFLAIPNWSSHSRGSNIRKNEKFNTCSNENYAFYLTSYFGVYVPSLILMTCIYLKILHVVVRHIKAIDATTPKYNMSHLIKDSKANKCEKSKFSRELKATKSLAFVYLAFVICWFPSCIINIIIFINNKYFPELKKQNLLFVNILYYAFVDILPIINTMVNPFIYSFSNKLFLEAFKRVIYKGTGGFIFSSKTSFQKSNISPLNSKCQKI